MKQKEPNKMEFHSNTHCFFLMRIHREIPTFLGIALWLSASAYDTNEIAAQELSPRSTTTKPLQLGDGESLIRAMEERTMATIEKSVGGVVAIARVERQVESRQQAFQFQLGLPSVASRFSSPDSPDFVPQGFGAGIVWDDSGTIVTAYHVLGDPRANDYYVWVDGRPLPAKAQPLKGEVQAGDPYSDIAVLKVDPVGLHPLERATESMPKKGQFVVHLGNPQGIARDGRMSAGWGIVANVQRSPQSNDVQQESADKETLQHYGTLIQVDSRMPIGCSGGALLNLEGQLIGMTVSIPSLNGEIPSFGFAIPIDRTFERVVESLRDGKLPAFGFLGIQPEDVSAEDRRHGKGGVRVVAVVRGMPGDLAGIREDDRLIAIDQRPVESRNALFRELSRKGADAEVEIRLSRIEANKPKEHTLRARLSKKFISTHRPAYAVQHEPLWRGIQVEYATALPPEMIRFPVRSNGTNAATLAAMSVEPDSPAWNAGLRSGAAIVSVDKTPVFTPSEFAKKVAQYEGRSVRIKIVNHSDKAEEIEIAP